MRERNNVKRTGLMIVVVALAAMSPLARAQDSVDVTFRYTNPSVGGVTLVGEFESTPWTSGLLPMTPQGGGLWTRTARLLIGGNPNPDVG